jgi:hypothetical protein
VRSRAMRAGFLGDRALCARGFFWIARYARGDFLCAQRTIFTDSDPQITVFLMVLTHIDIDIDIDMS